MLDVKYGKCLSNFWQKKNENGNIFGNIIFSLQNGKNFGNIDFTAFCNSYVFQMLQF